MQICNDLVSPFAKAENIKLQSNSMQEYGNVVHLIHGLDVYIDF